MVTPGHGVTTPATHSEPEGSGAAVSPWAGSFVPTGTVTSKFSFSLKIWHFVQWN